MEGSEPIALALPSGLRVTGETVEGEIHLDFLGLQKTPVEEVHVKLRGSVFTKITRSQGQNSVTRRQRIELLRATVSVWKRGGAYPQPGTDILKIPFRFALSPSQLLPSCAYSGFRKSGTVAYSIEVVGVRSGLHFNKRISRALSVLPPDAKGAGLSQQLRSGLVPSWRNVEFTKRIRKGIWGEYSSVKVTLSIPAIDRFPIFTPIPFVLSVVTVSKPMRQDETHNDQPIFPAPPLTPKGVEFKLSRSVLVRANIWWERGNNDVALLGGLGPVAPATEPHFNDVVQVEAMEKTWLPDFGDEKKNKGSWKQQVNFTSNFTLTCPPTFHSQTMNVDYFLSLKVDFPGIGNDLKSDIPIVVVSSMLPPGAGAWDGPPQELDLPPAYFSATDWNHDEKDSE